MCRQDDQTVGQDRGVDVAGRIAERCELGVQRLVLADLEPREAFVPAKPPGKYESSVTDARSWPVSNSNSPLACSIT
jgi:hypothetical protein